MISKKYLMSELVRKPTLIFWQIFYYLIQLALHIFADKILKMRLRAQGASQALERKAWETNQVRPTGELIWLHAVGLGEVMALRGLIDIILQTNLIILVTSGTLQSAELFSQNLPKIQHINSYH